MKLTTELKDLRGTVSACLKCANCTSSGGPMNISCALSILMTAVLRSVAAASCMLSILADKQIDYNKSLAELAFTCSS